VDESKQRRRIFVMHMKTLFKILQPFLFIGAVVLVLPIEIKQRYYTKIKTTNNNIL